MHGFADVEDVEQFAELIVRECINCIENTDKGYIFTAKDAGIVNAAHTRSMKKVAGHEIFHSQHQLIEFPFFWEKGITGFIV